MSTRLARRLLQEASREQSLCIIEFIANVLRGNLKISSAVRVRLLRSKIILRKLGGVQRASHAQDLLRQHYKTVISFLKACISLLRGLVKKLEETKASETSSDSPSSTSEEDSNEEEEVEEEESETDSEDCESLSESESENDTQSESQSECQSSACSTTSDNDSSHECPKMWNIEGADEKPSQDDGERAITQETTEGEGSESSDALTN